MTNVKVIKLRNSVPPATPAIYCPVTHLYLSIFGVIQMYYTPCNLYLGNYQLLPGSTGNILPASGSSPYPISTLNVRNESGIRCQFSRIHKPTGQALMASKRNWLPEEDKTIVYLRNQGRGWLAISKHLNERSSTACRLRYQNYLERWDTWDDDRKTQLAKQYLRYAVSLSPIMSLY